MADEVLLKAVQKGRWHPLHIGLLNDHHTLEVWVYKAGFSVRANGNIGEVTRSSVGVIYTPKILIEEVVETLVNFICLVQ